MNTLKKSRIRGFSLVEVLVALIIISIGMLGIAKMQALAMSSTGVSRTRSLAAIAASSMADAMHSNRSYWSAGLAGLSPAITAKNGAATSTNGLMATALGLAAGSLVAGPPPYSQLCNFSGATPACASAINLAGYDSYNWAVDLKNVLPTAKGNIDCNATDIPVDCTIIITWTENAVSANSNEATAAANNAASGTTAAILQPTYTLYVVP